MFALRGPIIVFPGYEDCVPEKLKNLIPIERMAQLVKKENELATDVEAVIYISTASLANPLDDDFFHIYMNLFKKYFGDKMLAAEPDFFKNVREMDGYLMDQLNQLKRWIRRKQLEAWKAKKKNEKKGEVVEK